MSLFSKKPKVNLSVRRNGMQEQGIWQSSKGVWYTKSLTVDSANSGNNLYGQINNWYGTMEHLEELTFTGIMRHWSANAVLPTDTRNAWLLVPSLKRLIITPTEVRQGNGNVFSADAAQYDSLTGTGFFAAGHYAFDNTNLEYLQLGGIGCRFNGGGYFRNEMPCPPGAGARNVGSEVGLTIVVYVSEYKSAAGFMNSLAPNTTMICRDWQTGEILTAT